MLSVGMWEEVFDVIIVGCGAAGIAAAIELKRLNPSVNYLILEGRDRLGGRAWTDRETFGQGIAVDLGAHYLCHHGEERNSLLQFYQPTDRDRIEIDFPSGSRMVIFDEDGTKIGKDDPLMEQSKDLFAKMEKKVKELHDDGEDDQSIEERIEEEWKEIVDVRLRHLVRLHWTFVETHEGSHLSSLSSLCYQQGEGDLQESDLSLHQGFGSLIEQIARENDLRVEFHRPVNEMKIDEEMVYLRTNDREREYHARFVLLTIPLACLKSRSLLFDPPLPSWKQKAIDTMGCSLLNKVFLQFSSRFWEKDLERIYLLGSRVQYYSCHWEESMLVLFVAGRQAKEMEEEDDPAIIEEIVRALRRSYPEITSPVRWLITRWGSDPFSLGSYSSFHRGNTRSILQDLARETHHGRVHWAGEHTNHQGCIGYVDSALQSGQREASLLHRKLSSPSIRSSSSPIDVEQ